MKLPPFYTIVWFEPIPHSFLREPFLGYLRKKKHGKSGYSEDITICGINNRELSIPITEVCDWWEVTEEEKLKGESH